MLTMNERTLDPMEGLPEDATNAEILARGDWLLTHGHDLALDPVCALLYREAQAAQLLTQQRIAGVR
jgi:hypothetical protein